MRNERGNELAPLAFHRRFDVPVPAGTERPPLFLALDNQANRNALHSPRTEPRLDLLPEHRRQRVAVEPIEDAPTLLRTNQVFVDVTRMVERFLDGVFGDLVEDDASDRDSWLENLCQVPADRLAFAIGVGREQELRCVLDGTLEVRDLLSFVARHHVIGRKVLLNIDTESSPVLFLDLLRHIRGRLGQIANMTVARLDSYLLPRKRPRVFAFAGDSTITRGFAAAIS